MRDTNPGLDGERYPRRPIGEPVSLDRVGLMMVAAFLLVAAVLFTVALMLHAQASAEVEAEVARSERIARTAIRESAALVDLWRENHTSPAAVIHADVVAWEVDR